MKLIGPSWSIAFCCIPPGFQAGVENHRDAPSSVDGGKAARSVVERSGKNNADGPRTGMIGQRVEQGVHGPVAQPVVRVRHEVGDVAIDEGEMARGFADVAGAMRQALGFLRHDDRQAA